MRGSLIVAVLPALSVALLSAAFGLRLLIVEGESMAPTIHSGDLVVTAALPLAVFGGPGSIVLRGERSGSPNGWLLHRVIQRGDGWRRTAGDASISPDAGVVEDRDVHGLLVAVIPVAPLSEILGQMFDRVGAAFTARRPIGFSAASATVAALSIESISTVGADAGGRLLPGGRVTASLLLGWSKSSPHVLQIDPAAFSAYAGSSNAGVKALARSLRIETRCRDATIQTSSWWAASDLLTAEWSASISSTGELLRVDPAAWPAGVRCEVAVTLLGNLGAQLAALQLPLSWSAT
jgi:signal peptidase I